MHATRPLRAAPPRSPLEIHPLARLRADGRLEILQAAFPPLGALCLILWHPGREPLFSVVRGTLARGWHWKGPATDAFVVLWFLDPTIESRL